VNAAGSIVASRDPTGRPSAWTTADIDGDNDLTGVSCPTTSLCVGVDSAGNAVTSRDPTGGESAWTTVHIDGTNALTGVSCPSASLCVAVDSEGNAVTTQDPTGSAGAWSVAQADQHVSYECYHYGGSGPQCQPGVNGVSCPSRSVCAATDSAGFVLESMAPTAGGSSWTGPTGNPGDDEALGGVSCPTVSFCVAADTYAGGVVTWDPGNVQSETFGGDTLNPDDDVLGVSCSSLSECFAWDDAGDIFSSSDLDSAAGSWARSTVDGGYVTGVSCPTATTCIASTEKGMLDLGSPSSPSPPRAQIVAALNRTAGERDLHSTTSLQRADGVQLRFAAPTAGKLTVTLYRQTGTRRHTLGQLRATIRGAGDLDKTLVISPGGRRWIRAARRFDMTAELTFVPKAGIAVNLHMSISVRP
jgi:hypothetical protein